MEDDLLAALSDSDSDIAIRTSLYAASSMTVALASIRRKLL